VQRGYGRPWWWLAAGGLGSRAVTLGRRAQGRRAVLSRTGRHQGWLAPDEQHGRVVVQGMTDVPQDIALQVVEHILRVGPVAERLAVGQREEVTGLVPGFTDPIGVEQQLITRAERHRGHVPRESREVRQAERQ